MQNERSQMRPNLARYSLVELPVVSKGKRDAFSLVELIVVMGLIGVLTAMLLPALAATRETAKMVQCQSNLRQIGQALFEYANVYKGALPCWSGWNVYPDGSSPEDAPGLAWTEELAFTFNQTPLSNVYNCPAFPVDVPMNYFLEARWSHLQGRHNIKMTDVRLSSAYILAGESTAPGGYMPPFGDAPQTTVDVDKSDEGFVHMAFANDPGGLNMHPAEAAKVTSTFLDCAYVFA